jgi:two-component system chemotaxis response regulator CheB
MATTLSATRLPALLEEFVASQSPTRSAPAGRSEPACRQEPGDCAVRYRAGGVRRSIVLANRDVLAIGTSAGGVEALRFLARSFPADLEASVLVTIHLASDFASSLDRILTREGRLAASFARDGDRLEKNRIYIGPPNHHLLVEDDRFVLGRGPRENYARPAIDPMLRSIALCCGHRGIGVVLTGTLGDGASGLWALKQCGGLTVVQDPADAAFAEMPSRALDRVQPDYVARLSELPSLLASLVRSPAGKPRAPPDVTRAEAGIARGLPAEMSDMNSIGKRSVFACPECNGVLWEIEDGDLARYRCHVGHAFSPDLMNVALDENMRRALATALRVLEERIALARHLGAEATQSGRNSLAALWTRRERDFRRERDVLLESMERIERITDVARRD